MSTLLKQTFWRKNARTPLCKNKSFGTRVMLPTITPASCLNVQTSDPNASGYLPPCCIRDFTDRRVAFTLLGNIFARGGRYGFYHTGLRQPSA